MLKLPINILANVFFATSFVLQICNFIFLVFGVYNLLLCVAGFMPMRRYAETAKHHRFAAVISARNEEQVLPYLLSSIRQASYQPELIDIIVIADNCTDSTGAVAKAGGAIVLTRENKNLIGKGHALRWAFEQIMNWQQSYDAFCIIDADNLVHPDFFAEMNRAYAAGNMLVQGYRHSKNAEDSWIAASHSFFYWLQNRFFNQARSVFGLSASINGTGFMIASDLIREKGWPTQTITEDIETTVLNVLDGRPTRWAPKAIVYDEQPLTFSQSWRQRNRWSVGNWQCFRLYGAKLLENFLRKPNLQCMDTLAFLLPVPLTLLTVLWAITQLTNGYFLRALPTSILLASGIAVGTNIANVAPTANMPHMLLTSDFSLAGIASYCITAFGAMLSVRLESRRQFQRLFRSCLLFPFFLLSWIGINVAILNSSTTPQWTPIAHVRAVNIESLLKSDE